MTETHQGRTALMSNDNKEAYESKMDAKLQEWQAEIDKLKAKSQSAGADAQIKYNDQIARLEQKKDEANAKLAAVKDASGDAWQELKDGVQQATSDLGDAIKSARQQF